MSQRVSRESEALWVPDFSLHITTIPKTIFEVKYQKRPSGSCFGDSFNPQGPVKPFTQGPSLRGRWGVFRVQIGNLLEIGERPNQFLPKWLKGKMWAVSIIFSWQRSQGLLISSWPHGMYIILRFPIDLLMSECQLYCDSGRICVYYVHMIL